MTTEPAMTPPGWTMGPGATGAWMPGYGTWAPAPGMWGQAPGLWGPEMGRLHGPTMFQQLFGLLRLIESTYAVDELLFAWHAQVLRTQPEMAREPAMERFGRTAQAALRAKVALAGLIRRMITGDMPHEAMRLVEEQVRTFMAEHGQALAAFRELLGRPQAADIHGIRVMRHLLGVGHQAIRSVADWATVSFGVQVEPAAADPPLEG